tara:strand:+ start:1099 stop:1704 length:606 start_codon:yes stop_codon:yes gene_type:complete
MGLSGILSLLKGLGKAGKQVFSPATQVRNLTGATNLKRAQGRSKWMADPTKRNAYNKSMEEAKREVDKLIEQGVVNKNQKLETYQRIEQALVKKYDEFNIPDYEALGRRAPMSNFTAFPQELIRKWGKEAAWAAIGGAAGYGVGKNEEAIKEMLETVQLPTDVAPVEEAPEQTFREKFESGQWGEDVGESLIDIIWPFSRD